jgi:dCTP deaminase
MTDDKNVIEVPSKEEIRRRFDLSNNDPSKIVVTPLIDEDQVEEGTVDLRLSTEFVLTKRSKFATLDAADVMSNMDLKILEYQERTYVKFGDHLILHPQQFALGATFEYVKMPVDMIGYVLGRSSWGRLGLIIATATMVHTGYAGIITLELTNLGDTPITLYPGTRIAQLALHHVGMTSKERDEKWKRAATEKTKYKASVSPVFSKIHQDKEWSMIRKFKEKNR